MGNLKSTQALTLLLLYLGTSLISLACPDCPYPTPLSKSPNLPLKYLLKVKPPVAKPPPAALKPRPHVPKHPTGKLPHISKPTLYFSRGYYAFLDKPPIVHPPRQPRRPIVHPPIRPELPIFATLSITPKLPIVYPPIIPTPPITPAPPVITLPPLLPVVPQPLPETPSPPPSPEEMPSLPPPPLETCPTLKLHECIDELGDLVHVGIGSKAKDTCCPVLVRLLDLDAALCLCTTIKAKLLNINIVIPVALQVFVNCGKSPPSGFQCPV